MDPNLGDIEETLQCLAQKVRELEQQAFFCISNYKFHHKNDEHVIIEQYQKLINTAAQQCKKFIRNMNTLRTSIVKSQKKCAEINVLLEQIKFNSEESDM